MSQALGEEDVVVEVEEVEEVVEEVTDMIAMVVVSKFFSFLLREYVLLALGKVTLCKLSSSFNLPTLKSINCSGGGESVGGYADHRKDTEVENKVLVAKKS